MKVIDGREGKYYSEEGDYTFQILDRDEEVVWEQERDIEFVLYTNPPTEVENSTEMFNIPYDPEFREFRVVHEGEKIFNQELELCNNNSICEDFETHFSCPSDCASHAEDGICNPELDGSCDPDCANASDLDCLCGNGVCDIEEGENREICPQDCDSGIQDNYCDGEEDGICDPDCEPYEDPDCTRENENDSCNYNGECEVEEGENYGNCPEDCDSGIQDNYCDGEEDGICDPDCLPEYDPDCEEGGTGVPVWVYGVLVGVAILILFVIMMSVKVER